MKDYAHILEKINLSICRLSIFLETSFISFIMNLSFPLLTSAITKAGTIGAAPVQISYYSAGRCAEKLNGITFAEELYLN